MGAAQSQNAPTSVVPCCSQHPISFSSAEASLAATLFSSAATSAANGQPATAASLRSAFPALRGFRESALARVLTSPGGSTAQGKQRRRDASPGPVTLEQWQKFLQFARTACSSPSACARLAWSLAAEADVQEGGGLSWRLSAEGAGALADAALWPWAGGGVPAALPCAGGAPPALAFPRGGGADAWARGAALAGFALALAREGGDEGAFLARAGGMLARVPRRVASLLGTGSPAAQRELICRCLQDAAAAGGGGGGSAPPLVAAVPAEWWASWADFVDWYGWRAREGGGAAPPPPSPPPPLAGAALPLSALSAGETAEWALLAGVADALGSGAPAGAGDGGAWLGVDGAGGGALGGSGGAPLLPWAPLLQPAAGAEGRSSASGGDCYRR